MNTLLKKILIQKLLNGKLHMVVPCLQTVGETLGLLGLAGCMDQGILLKMIFLTASGPE